MPTINIFGTKGGVGVTTLTAALAYHLADRRTVEVNARVDELDSLAAALGCGTQPETGTVITNGLWFGDRPGSPAEIVINDCGTNVAEVGLTAPGDLNLLVTRACYLGLRRFIRGVGEEDRTRFAGIVLLEEPGRALGDREVRDVTGLPILTKVPVTDSIARAIDAGVLGVRTPDPLRRSLDELIAAKVPTPILG